MIKSGYAAIIGSPNAGKSTLLNAMLGFKFSAVNPKVQTTRHKIMAVMTGENYQIIFLDTPGILDPKYAMHDLMLKEIKSAFKESDLIIYLFDATKLSLKEFQQNELRFKKDLKKVSKITVLNKCDLLTQQQVADKMVSLTQETGLENIIPISALTKYNLDTLKNKIIDLLPEGDFYFDEDTLTDKPVKFFVAEIIREKILELYKEEIPYSVMIDIREFKTRAENQKDYINADIILERESQKIIMLGKKGSMMKKLGALARKDIEEFLGKEVYLNLFVKVRKDWRKDFNFLKNNF